MSKRVFCGPWIGEFGYEIVFWQGKLRKYLKENHRDDEIIVIGPMGHDFFYEYADKYIHLGEDFVDSFGAVSGPMYDNFEETQFGRINHIYKKDPIIVNVLRENGCTQEDIWISPMFKVPSVGGVKILV